MVPENPEGIPHPSADGVVAVETDHGTIHVPEGLVDTTVRYETPDGVKHEWVNPDAPADEVIKDPGDTEAGDLIYDAALGGYVHRLRAAETGGGGDTATTQ